MYNVFQVPPVKSLRTSRGPCTPGWETLLYTMECKNCEAEHYNLMSKLWGCTLYCLEYLTALHLIQSPTSLEEDWKMSRRRLGDYFKVLRISLLKSNVHFDHNSHEISSRF